MKLPHGGWWENKHVGIQTSTYDDAHTISFPFTIPCIEAADMSDIVPEVVGIGKEKEGEKKSDVYMVVVVEMCVAVVISLSSRNAKGMACA